MDAAGLLAYKAWLEEHLWAAEALAAHSDDVAVWQLVGLLLVAALRGSLHFGVEIQGNVGQLLLHVAHDLTLSSGGEGVAALCEDLHQVLGQITAGQVQTQNGVRQRIALVDGHGVRHAISAVHHDARGAARGVERQHSLDCHIHGRHVEGLEHDLRHALAVGLGVQGSLSQEHWVLLWSHSELVVEGVVPDLLHVVPVGDDAVLNGVLESQHTTLALRLITDVAVLLVHAHHDARHLGPSHDGRKDSPWSIVTCEACLAHAAAIVNHQSGNLLVTHDCYGQKLG
mmetsp:Transcript_41744/g.75496  ORF Transcript_41744/g.75496 Transcript_41744/m.75496 type:complete len:285 (+) Transcript_41744:610-1464(+)